MEDIKVIGIDLGATNIRGAVVTGNAISDIVSARIHSDGSVEDVLNDIYQVVDALIDDSVKAIGIGVPSVVDVAEGVVYDVLYIPSWIEVPLKKLMEARYHVPVFVNNDANCFAVGEYHFGKGNGVDSMIGLTLGTGLGAGVIINNKLYAGYWIIYWSIIAVALSFKMCTSWMVCRFLRMQKKAMPRHWPYTQNWAHI
jgi:glucokinase